MVGDDLLLPRGADIQAPVRIILRVSTSRLGRLRVGRRPRVGHAEVVFPPPSARGAVLVPAFSTADAAVAPVPAVVLVTHAVKTAGDCSIDVSFALLPNASWPEAFLLLFDVVRGALHTCNKPQSKWKHNKLIYDKVQEISFVTHLVADLRPGLQGLRGLSSPLRRPKVSNFVSARPGAPLSH
jgi:hypothetical protein